MLPHLLTCLGSLLPFRLLTRGNAKLGSISIWSIPAVATCPGSSALCRASCYATKGFYQQSNVIESLFKRLAICASPFFVLWMILSIRLQHSKVVRIHSAGDFYSSGYIAAWLTIVKACPGVQFFAYTRSWRVPVLRELLVQLSLQPNVQLWYSCDAETGIPVLTKEERFIRNAYMAVNLQDIPTRAVDLVFRDYPTRAIVQKHVYGDLVCPAENGTGAHITCDKCQLCFSAEKAAKMKNFFPGVNRRRPCGFRRVSLTLV